MNQCVTSSKTKMASLSGLDARDVDLLPIQNLLITQLEAQQVNRILNY